MMLYGPLFIWLLVTIFGPYDVTQGVSSKLLYIHVPTVWIAYLAYTLTFLYSALYLFSKKSKYDSIAIANANSGVVFTIITPDSLLHTVRELTPGLHPIRTPRHLPSPQ